MAKFKLFSICHLLFAICHLKSPYRFVVLALPLVVATAFDNMARNWFDSSRTADNRLLGTISALASNRSQ
jgi:hypothetical protein